MTTIGAGSQRRLAVVRVMAVTALLLASAAMPVHAALLAGTKTVSGTFMPGGAVTYTITLTNLDTVPQADAPTDEFADVLPSSLTLVSANASSGTAVASVGTNTVSWNGGLAPLGGSVTITIEATIVGSTGAGTSIENQGAIHFDVNNDGTNESDSVTDDPSTGAPLDATEFLVISRAALSATKTVAGAFRPGGSISYTVVIVNAGPEAQSDNPGNEFTDVLPASLALVSANTSSGTAVANVGTRTVTWNGAIPSGGSVTILINATVDPASPPGTLVSNQGAASFDADGNGTNEATALTDDPGVAGATNPTAFSLVSAATLTATKTVAGTFTPGGSITYTVVISNAGPATQVDNPGNEFADVLPASLTLASATSTSGTAMATTATGTVTWNGSLAASGSVTITIGATIQAATAAGAVVTNQGTFSFDADGNGTNEATGLTNDPATPAANDGTSFTVMPPAMITSYFAEGATGTFWETNFALLNPGTTAATVLLRFLTDDGQTVSTSVTVPAGARRTINPETLTGLTSASFSAVIESNVFIVADRTMTWADGQGSHAETAIASPSTTWYLAEGSTSGEFNLFYLLQNAGSVVAQATVRYLRPGGQPPIVKSYTLPPTSRTTIYVDVEGPELASTDVSAVITATAPIVVERTMYLNQPGQPFAAGHASAGVTAPALTWFLAEGATGPFFDLFVLIANPSDAPANVSADYLLADGGVLTKTYMVPANGRFTIYVDAEEIPAASGQRPLANVAVSTTIRSTNAVPVVVERAMWWPGVEVTPNFWYEAHSSPGATSTGTRWGLAEGEVGGVTGLETFVLIANTSLTPGSARVSLHFEDGTTIERTYPLAPTSRTSVGVGSDFPDAAGRKFGVIVESLGTVPAEIVVERAMYSSAGGLLWAAGTDALATRLPQ